MNKRPASRKRGKGRNRGRKSKIWIEAGTALIISAILLTLVNIRENLNAAWESSRILYEMQLQSSEEKFAAESSGNRESNSPSAQNAPETEPTPLPVVDPETPMPEIDVNGDKYIGTLEIPALDLTLPVMSFYHDLKIQNAPCRYAGSLYQNNMVIAAHNYSYHFGRIDTLQPGDLAVFTDTEGNRFEFCLIDTEMLKNTDVEKMVDSENWDLTLFTCTVGGASRVTARFRLVSAFRY